MLLSVLRATAAHLEIQQKKKKIGPRLVKDWALALEYKPQNTMGLCPLKIYKTKKITNKLLLPG